MKTNWIADFRLFTLSAILWCGLSGLVYRFDKVNGVYDWAKLNGITAGLWAAVGDLWLGMIFATLFNAAVFGLLIVVIKDLLFRVFLERRKRRDRLAAIRKTDSIVGQGI